MRGIPESESKLIFGVIGRDINKAGRVWGGSIQSGKFTALDLFILEVSCFHAESKSTVQPRQKTTEYLIRLRDTPKALRSLISLRAARRRPRDNVNFAAAARRRPGLRKAPLGVGGSLRTRFHKAP